MSNTTATDIIKSLPKDSFLARYIDMMSVLETSLVYDFWCAMFCLSNAVGRSVVVDRPRAPVRLNLYVILTAESGVTRKSTAVNTAARIMEKFNERTGNRISLINTKTTPERLEQVLSVSSTKVGSACFSFIVSELVTALGSERYNLSMPGLLTDLFDSPTIRRTTGTVSGGSQELRNVYGTFLSASTPSWLTRAINPDVIEGGFTSRVFFVISDAPKQRVAWPSRRDDESEEQLVDQLVGIYDGIRSQLTARSPEAKFVLDQAALKSFQEWYETRELGIDPFTSSFDAREDGHILKTAALLTINRNSGVIGAGDIRDALILITETVKQRSVELLSYQVNNALIDALERIRSVLLQQPTGTKHGELLRKIQTVAKAKRANVILDTMHHLGMVKKFAYGHTAQGRPGVMWTPQPALKSADYMKIMLENLEGAE